MSKYSEQQAKGMFDQFDKDKNGTIDRKEIMQLLTNMKKDPEVAKKICKVSYLIHTYIHTYIYIINNVLGVGLCLDNLGQSPATLFMLFGDI